MGWPSLRAAPMAHLVWVTQVIASLVLVKYSIECF